MLPLLLPSRLSNALLPALYSGLLGNASVSLLVSCMVLVSRVSQEVMKDERMSFKASAKRDTPVKENLRLFQLLLKGDREAEPYCLRAKADYASVNG